MKGRKELTLGIENFNCDLGKKVNGFEGVHEENGIGVQNLQSRVLLKFCYQKDCSKEQNPVKEVSIEEVTSAMKKMKLEKASGLSKVSIEMINASGKVGIDVMIKLFHRVLDGKEMPEDWKTSMLVPIYKGKGNVTNCGA